VTFISLSLTKNANDVLECKQLLKQHNSECRVIAKLERIDALRNFDSILEVADAVILSRACLGLDVPVEKIALIQKLVRGSQAFKSPQEPSAGRLVSVCSSWTHPFVLPGAPEGVERVSGPPLRGVCDGWLRRC